MKIFQRREKRRETIVRKMARRARRGKLSQSKAIMVIVSIALGTMSVRCFSKVWKIEPHRVVETMVRGKETRSTRQIVRT